VGRPSGAGDDRRAQAGRFPRTRLALISVAAAAVAAVPVVVLAVHAGGPAERRNDSAMRGHARREEARDRRGEDVRDGAEGAALRATRRRRTPLPAGPHGAAGDVAPHVTPYVAPRGGRHRAGGAPEGQPAPRSRPRNAAALALHRRLRGRFPLRADLALNGRFTAVRGSARPPAKPKGRTLRSAARVYRYRVDVEKGLPLDGALFAALVHETLNDRRSWGHDGSMAFRRVSTGRPDFVVTLASPGTTDVWCAKSGLDTSIDHVSCDSAATPRVMINAYRWARGARTWGRNMLGYRQMLINHEVGHRLGHGHRTCPRDGALAPVMMQQTKFLTTAGATCRPNAWPYPRG
jgi:Protein of unknown function (DUF3152)